MATWTQLLNTGATSIANFHPDWDIAMTRAGKKEMTETMAAERAANRTYTSGQQGSTTRRTAI